VRRSGRSRKERHRRRHSSSSSTSPVRRSRRHKDYSTSSSSSNSSETEYHHRRRRKRRYRKGRPLIYRIGDMVLYKQRGSRRRRSRWVPVEVCEVHGGMYGEITYSVWLLNERRMLEFVRTDELRFKYHHELERRLRDDEILHRRDELRETNYEFTRYERDRGLSRGRRMDTYGGGRGRSRRSARAGQLRARSAEGNFHISARRDTQNERAMSVPPENTNWPVFLAEFAKLIYRDRSADRHYSGDDLQYDDVEQKTGVYSSNVRYNDRLIDENERDRRVRRDFFNEIDDMNRVGDNNDNRMEFERNHVERTPPPNDNYMGDRRGNYTMDFKDRGHRGSLHLNFVLPDCRGTQDRES